MGREDGGGSITFDFTVGQSYPIHYRGGQASLEFVGMLSNGTQNILLFHNPLQLGVPFDYVGAVPVTRWPDQALPTVTVEFRLEARFAGQGISNMATIDRGASSTWGSGVIAPPGFGDRG